MILVIADDISGAAELAYAAHARGLKAEVQTAFTPERPADVIALDTDTRSLTSHQAAKKIKVLAETIVAARPEWVYKKTDSVLRGNIRSEISALLETIELKRSLFIPANPSRGRVIHHGQYFVQGVALENTVFKSDPEYPAHTSDVAALAQRSPGAEIHVLSPGKRPPDRGIAIPEVTSRDDLVRYASEVDGDTLPAGASEFFETLLALRGPSKNATISRASGLRAVPATERLFVCGSAAAWPQRRAAGQSSGIPCRALPPAVFDSSLAEPTSLALLDDWVLSVAKAFHEQGTALVGIGDSPETRHCSASELVLLLARGVALLLDKIQPHRLLIEGGATAIAVVRQMRWRRLEVVCAFAQGLGALRPDSPDSPELVIKPGSYDWPAVLWDGPESTCR